MQAVSDWREVLKHAWSVRLMLVSALLNGLAAALMFGQFLPIPPLAFFILTLVVNVAAILARFIAQKHIGGAQ